MKTEVKQDIINVLKGVRKALDKGNSYAVKELSNHVIHSASIFQDNYTTSVAVLVYALSKIMEREKFQITKQSTEFYHEVKSYIEMMINSLTKDDLRGLSANIKKVLRAIARIDTGYPEYIRWILTRSKIKKGTKIYEHGISLGRVAELLGISQWELMDYFGATKIHDRDTTKKTPPERIKHARKIFGGKDE